MILDAVKLVADLCAIIGQQNAIIKAQALVLAEHGAVIMAEEIDAAQAKYKEVVGEA